MIMTKSIAILGAGPGLGASLARTYGKQGYAVALVARRAAALEAMVAQLSGEGITAAAFTANLRDPVEVTAAMADIQSRFGDIETLYYGPSAPEVFVPAFSLAPDDVKAKTELFLYGLVAAVQAVLPGMRRAKAGTILVALGGSAAVGLPFMSGPGPALAAARNYLHSLHGELANEGIYVGMLTLSAVIRQSAWHAGLISGDIKIDLPPGFAIPEIEPSDLAQMLWQLAEARQAPELVYPAAP
ncbi:SDR family NAD(P)-dependent oxidoreductase [Nitrospirillum sp. BR 11752]|uniref:SDR family NAD(P)-dependent oxidoreductase n=1 Tax=Nitrospirillum sp. BR 11752 TaxID=3104293 RepID=UPI002EA0B003|nr:SDR family NAD(P)-dependent oxidoreductase [Nitrospirillum sp. BR 11752]